MLVMSARAKSRLEPKRRSIGLIFQIGAPDGLCLAEIIMAPATTIIIASHCR